MLGGIQIFAGKTRLGDSRFRRDAGGFGAAEPLCLAAAASVGIVLAVEDPERIQLFPEPLRIHVRRRVEKPLLVRVLFGAEKERGAEQPRKPQKIGVCELFRDRTDPVGKRFGRDFGFVLEDREKKRLAVPRGKRKIGDAPAQGAPLGGEPEPSRGFQPSARFPDFPYNRR